MTERMPPGDVIDARQNLPLHRYERDRSEDAAAVAGWGTTETQQRASPIVAATIVELEAQLIGPRLHLGPTVRVRGRLDEVDANAQTAGSMRGQILGVAANLGGVGAAGDDRAEVKVR